MYATNPYHSLITLSLSLFASDRKIEKIPRFECVKPSETIQVMRDSNARPVIVVGASLASNFEGI